jgi:hypothetical protein
MLFFLSLPRSVISSTEMLFFLIFLHNHDTNQQNTPKGNRYK